MYESYSWPGAYTFKDEIKIFINWFRKKINPLIKRIKDFENEY